ncbi:Developmental regulatory protein wetA [Colletotrichum orbiculare MAFF 240422]|uniref:Developmental regulatory protein wetA n=2 Tax=Colletotrichum orbiculare species complex TaxID=2707354 RepID=A0A484G9D8_COLOR|nr:Developmental regulatory protein wetA [Colletotrichum orbiculare MAFF 240422]
MAVAFSHWTSPGTIARSSSQLTDYDEDMTYSEVQFSVEPMDADKDGYHTEPSHLEWEGVTTTETAGGGGGGGGGVGPTAGAVDDDGLLFDEFVDLESLSPAGDDELHGNSALPDSFFLNNMPLPPGYDTTNLHLAGSSSSNNNNNNNRNSNSNNGGRKPSSFFKAVASKLQQKAASVRHKQPNMSSVVVDTRGPLSPNASPRKAFKLRPEHLTGLGGPPTRLPLSPPNSATIPHDLPSHSTGGNGVTFCGGYIEDPFFDASVAGGAVPMFRRSDPTTPMDTPVLDDKGGMFYHHPQMSSSSVANTSKATWPMATTTTPQTDTHVAWSNAYATNDALDNQWWDGTGMDLTSATNPQYQAQNARNATFNLAMHTQHNELPYEYNNIAAGGSEMSGLMIHLPQSRTASSPVLHYQPQQLHHPQQPQMTERRPRMPRAPSAGARHLCLSTPMRKTRNPSRSRQGSRDSSTSPTPTNRGSRHSSNGSLGSFGTATGALGASVKKRRSWSRRESLRTPSIGSNLGGSASESMGFVNFTPSDKSILMTGVAPSGSSKTKARREKEAMEKRRRLSEAAIKAVKAAGGDVDKLVEEGLL